MYVQMGSWQGIKLKQTLFGTPKVAIFDFDGVITDSVTLKAGAFVELFANASEQEKTKIIDFHLANGGVSREKKIRHFCENIFKLHLSSDQIKKLSDNFAHSIIQKLLVAPAIPGVGLILEKYRSLNVKCFINSAAPAVEIEQFLEAKGWQRDFSLVLGATESKIKNMKSILALSDIHPSEAIFFGDSHSDLIVAKRTGVKFVGIGSAMVKEATKGNLAFAAQDFDAMLAEIL
jgi:phosphoglycolate phosphatase-like HAD superfamily hydrolase